MRNYGYDNLKLFASINIFERVKIDSLINGIQGSKVVKTIGREIANLKNKGLQMIL